MSEFALKALFVLDQTTSTFSPLAHNLSAQEAVEKFRELERQGKKVQILDQPSRHRAMTFKRCKPCATTAQNLSQSRPAQVVQEQGETSRES